VTDDRVVPHSLEAEKALLGSVLLKDAVWPEVASDVIARHFFRAAHQVIYEAMGQCKERGLAIELVTLKHVLGSRLEGVGGSAYIASLIDGMPIAMNVKHYATIVREKALLRDTIDAGNALVAAAYGSDDEPAQVLEDGVRSLLSLAVKSATGPVPVGTAVREYVTALDTDATASVLPTGHHDLDELLAGGVRKGELTIVAARPSVGKTSFALGIGKAAAHAGGPGVVFSMEMRRQALAGRMLAWESRVDLHRASAHALSGDDYARMTDAWAKMDTLPLLIEDSVTTLTQATAWCQRLQQRPEGLACAVFDYIQLMSAPENRQDRSRNESVGSLSRGLKRLAQDLNIAVVACSQLSRAPEGRQDKRPHLSDLRESGALEQDADVAILLFREEMYKKTDDNAGIAEAIIAKQRNGPTGVTRLAFLSQFAQFCDLA
jgi:replicative DNA helicase